MLDSLQLGMDLGDIIDKDKSTEYAESSQQRATHGAEESQQDKQLQLEDEQLKHAELQSTVYALQEAQHVASMTGALEASKLHEQLDSSNHEVTVLNSQITHLRELRASALEQNAHFAQSAELLRLGSEAKEKRAILRLQEDASAKHDAIMMQTQE